MPKCSECKYFDGDTQERARGLCRRFPPVPQLELRTSEEGAAVLLPFTNAPITLADAWCGEFQAGAMQ